MKKKLLGSALALAATFSMGSAQALVIDDFNGGDQSVTAPGSNTIAYGSAVGGSRTLDITKSGPLSATADVVLGFYSHSSAAGTSATSTIIWDANGAGLGGVDFVEGLTNNVFSFDILGIDQGNIDLVLSVTDTFGGSSSFTFSNAAVGIESVPFSSFAGVDFTVVDSLSLQVVGDVASDLTLDLLATTGDQVVAQVPEPGPLALMAIGLLAFGFTRRKAK